MTTYGSSIQEGFATCGLSRISIGEALSFSGICRRTWEKRWCQRKWVVEAQRYSEQGTRNNGKFLQPRKKKPGRRPRNSGVSAILIYTYFSLFLSFRLSLLFLTLFLFLFPSRPLFHVVAYFSLCSPFLRSHHHFHSPLRHTATYVRLYSFSFSLLLHFFFFLSPVLFH